MKEYFSDRKTIIIFAVVVMAITMIPYLLGYSNQGEELRYTGFVIGVEDGNSYIAKMRSGAEGNWLFRSPHSAQDQKGAIAYLPYILLGKLASSPASHEQLVALYHIARLFFGILAILASYDFVSIYISPPSHRIRALVLIILGGGLGWVLVLINQKGFLGSLPLEFISPESFGFLGTFGFPHLAAARALFLWGLVLFLKTENGYLSGLCWLMMGFFQPMIVVIAWAVIGVYFVAIIGVRKFAKKQDLISERTTIKIMALKIFQAVLCSAPIVFYTAYVFLYDPYFRAWTEQNRFPSPHIIHYLIAYGLIIPLAAKGIWKMIKKKKNEALLLAGWLFILPILVYAPVITQRRLAEGIWVVLIIGLLSNYNDLEKFPLPVRGLTVLLFPSTLLIFSGSIFRAINPSEPIFRNADEVAAYTYLSKEASPGSVILSSFEIGNNLPAWAPVRVVMGHGPETVGLEMIKTDIDNYFNQDYKTEACGEFFEEYKIDYLFWGPVEAREWAIDPGTLDCLKPIYNGQGYQIFEVEG